jgi:hypothetical protein
MHPARRHDDPPPGVAGRLPASVKGALATAFETLPNAIRKVSFHHLREGDMERELGAIARRRGRAILRRLRLCWQGAR